jgi:hypothetical protein
MKLLEIKKPMKLVIARKLSTHRRALVEMENVYEFSYYYRV